MTYTDILWTGQVLLGWVKVPPPLAPLLDLLLGSSRPVRVDRTWVNDAIVKAFEIYTFEIKSTVACSTGL